MRAISSLVLAPVAELGVAGVAQVVEAEVLDAGRSPGRLPAPLDHVGVEEIAGLGREDQGIRPGGHPGFQVRFDLGDEVGWDDDPPPASCGLGRPEDHFATSQVLHGALHDDDAVEQVDVSSSQRQQLAPPQPAPCGKKDQRPPAGLN